MVITGVIKPPPDIRAVADRTALFVARNGRAFEERILNSDKGKTPKFSFLTATSPFHAYYEERIRFHEEGGDEGEPQEDSKEKEDEQKRVEDNKVDAGVQKEEAEKKKEKAQKASALDPLARALLNQRAKISDARAAMEEREDGDEATQPVVGVIPPPKLNFVSVAAPAHLTTVQLETIRLVAQFAALSGTGGPFLQQLAMREWNNPLFAFLQPRHGHFAYFSALVDGYRVLLSTWTGKASASDNEILPVVECASSVSGALAVSAYRAEYDRDAAKRRQEELEASGGGALSGAATIDWYDFIVVETIDFPVDEVVSTLTLPPPTAAAEEVTEETMEESEDEDGERIRVVPNYTPKVVSTQNVAKDMSRTHAIDPITMESVALADTSEHMRIQFLDPKWAEQRQKFVDKQKESNLVGGDVIAGNISRFAQARGDLFGSSEAERLGTDADSKKRLEEANRVIREQAQHPPPMVGGPGPVQPSGAGINMPPPQASVQLPAPTVDQAVSVESPHSDLSPPTKRPRLEPTANEMLTSPDEAMASAQNMAMPSPPVPLPGLQTEQQKPAELLPEKEFAAFLQAPTVQLRIQIPKDTSNTAWNFNGQVVSLAFDVMTKIGAIKAELRSHLGGMPLKKIQLKSQNAGFLNKDDLTLASLNIGPNADLDMVPKTRGGRK